MTRSALRLLACAFVALLALAPSAMADPSAQGLAHRHVCGAVGNGEARCFSDVVVDRQGKPVRNTTPKGYGPADLRSAYKLTSSGSSSQTIAIVDAYDDPNAEADLAAYRSQFSLPACTTANGCFRKLNQRGVAGSYPRANGGWAQEISLDLDMASAICPSCKILLVEADSNLFTDLAAAVDTAAAQRPSAISNSYGGSEFSSEGSSTYDGHYHHPGIALTVSAGDAGYGAEFPASSANVTAVGGTSLKRASGTSRGWSETVWSGTGSGCSAYIPKPSWQTSTTSCGNRAVSDVSAVADPNTGVAVYDTYSYQGQSGWLTFGGTSASAPIIAGVYALAGNTSGADGANIPWGASGHFFDVTSGSNGSCSTAVWCTAGTGWDGPTGLGTPNGTGAF